jgi:hypothetical protein
MNDAWLKAQVGNEKLVMVFVSGQLRQVFDVRQTTVFRALPTLLAIPFIDSID